MQINYTEKKIALIAFVIFIISLIPLLYMARYLHPSTDDYVFAADTYHTWTETHSVLQTLQTAADVTSQIYHDWQGTYTGCFLMALQPGIFDAYWVTPFIIIGIFIFANFWLMHVIFRQYLKSSYWQYLLISTTVTMLSMQFVKSPFDAFYWYNGAMFYTTYYSLALLLATTIIKSILVKNKAMKVAFGVASLLLCIFIAGGNYMIGLFTPTAMATAIILRLCLKKKVPVILYASFAVFCISFFFSITAPGNAIRESYITTKTSPIWSSLTYGCSMLVKHTNLTALALFIFISPILSKLARDSKFSFRKPWLCVAITYGVYCSLFTPHILRIGNCRLRPQLEHLPIFLLLVRADKPVLYLWGNLERIPNSQRT